MIASICLPTVSVPSRYSRDGFWSGSALPTLTASRSMKKGPMSPTSTTAKRRKSPMNSTGKVRSHLGKLRVQTRACWAVSIAVAIAESTPGGSLSESICNARVKFWQKQIEDQGGNADSYDDQKRQPVDDRVVKCSDRRKKQSADTGIAKDNFD